MLVLIFVLGSGLTVAQENYIEHPIKKGESVYVISRKYGVSMKSIFELNPGSENIIYAGRTLRVPKSNASQGATVISDSLITNYRVKRGETKSGLARRFGVTIAMLEQQNPHIIRMLQADHVIDVDKSIAEVKPTAKEGEHIVIKGETLWEISRRNGISLAQLTAANSSRLSEYLQIGQILIIPDKDFIVTNPGEYVVQKGDTKFALAKRFNMTIEDLEQKNPHIIDMLMAGHKIDIDQTDTTNTDLEITGTNENDEAQDSIPVEGTITQSDSLATGNGFDKRYVDYVIQPKETLFGLSQRAGMTIEDFTELNPKLKTAVNAGDIIKMPTDSIMADTIIDPDKEPDNQETVPSKNSNTPLLNNLDTEAKNGIYIYSPFSSDELNSIALIQDKVNSNEKYQKFVDFYRGAQMAMDSARALNLNFDITLIKKNITTSELKIDSSYKKNALIAPFLEDVAQYPKIISTDSVAIINIESNLSSIEDSMIYNPLPSENFQKTKTLNYIANRNANVIVLSDLKEARNRELIINTIPDAKFLKVDNAGVFAENALQNALLENKPNYIIFDSKKTIVFINTTNALMSKLPNYNMQLVLIDPSLLPEQTEVSNLRYKILKLIYPIFINPQEKKSITDFETKYNNLHNIEPSKYAVIGFNVTLDLLLRLSQNSSFENAVKNLSSEQTHIKFDYKKTTDNSYYNRGFYLLQYDSDDGLIELDKE